MQTVTITIEQIMIAIPVSVALYCIAYNRKWLWGVKKTLFHIFLGCASTACIGTVGSTIVFLPKQNQNQIQKDRIEKMRLARKTPVLLNCADPEQVDLPGEWWYLYQSLVKSSFWEAKLLGIEAFASQYRITDVPPLPMVGLNLILDELYVKSAQKQTWKYIRRATAALKPYLRAFNEACSTESKKSEEKTLSADVTIPASADMLKGKAIIPLVLGLGIGVVTVKLSVNM